MKKMIRLNTGIALVLLTLAGAAQAAGITRSVKVVEGTETKLYLGTLFGQTLYTFDLDKATGSACNQDCAEKWPPILVTATQAKSLVAPYSTTPRANGLLQVTYEGKPIYTFYQDHAEGDDKGDGVGGVWHDIDFKN